MDQKNKDNASLPNNLSSQPLAASAILIPAEQSDIKEHKKTIHSSHKILTALKIAMEQQHKDEHHFPSEVASDLKLSSPPASQVLTCLDEYFEAMIMQHSNLNEVFAKLKEEKEKLLPYQRRPYFYKFLAIFTFIAIFGETFYEIFTWEVEKNVIRGKSSLNQGQEVSPITDDKNLQDLILAILAPFFAGDVAFNVLTLDFLDSPKMLLEYLFIHEDEPIKQSWGEWIIADFLPFWSMLPMIHYINGAAADISGLSVVTNSTGVQYFLNSLSLIAVPIFYISMYAENKLQFRKFVHELFNTSNTQEFRLNPFSWQQKAIRIYDFLKTWLVYVTIRTINFEFFGALTVNMIANWQVVNEDPNSKSMTRLFWSNQVLLGFGTIIEIISSQTLKNWFNIWVASSDADEFHSFFSVRFSRHRENFINHCVTIALGIATTYLPSNLIFIAASEAGYAPIFSGLFAAIPALLFTFLENKVQMNRDQVALFKLHKEIKKLYTEFYIFIKTLNDSSPQMSVSNSDETITYEAMSKTYKNIKNLINFFETSLCKQKINEIDNPVKKKQLIESIEYLCNILQPHLQKYEKMMKLYENFKIQVGIIDTVSSDDLTPGASINNMYNNISRLYLDHKADSQEASIDISMIKEALIKFCTLGTLVTRQVILIGFFQNLSEKYHPVSQEIILASTLSLGTQRSINAWPTFQGFVRGGITAWWERLSFLGSKASSAFTCCRRRQHQSGHGADYVPLTDAPLPSHKVLNG